MNNRACNPKGPLSSRIARGIWPFLFLMFACGPGLSLAQGSIEEAMQDWYGGGGVSRANTYSYTDTCFGCYGEAVYGDADLGYTFTAGYRFSPYIAAEVSYLDAGTLEWNDPFVLVSGLNDVFDVDAAIDLTSYQVSILGILPFADIWEVYIRGGVALWDAQSNQALRGISGGGVLARRLHESGSDFLLGGGGGVTLGERWHIRLDYVYFPIEDDLLALGDYDEAYSDVVTLQLHYRLGERR